VFRIYKYWYPVRGTEPARKLNFDNQLIYNLKMADRLQLYAQRSYRSDTPGDSVRDIRVYNELNKIQAWRRVFSNLWDGEPFPYKGATYKTFVHAYQAEKFWWSGMPYKSIDFSLESGSKLSHADGFSAAREGRKTRIPPQDLRRWDQINRGIKHKIYKAKYSMPLARKTLLATGNAELWNARTRCFRLEYFRALFRLEELVKELAKDRDSSHDFAHSKKVVQNALEIFENTIAPNHPLIRECGWLATWGIIEVSALLHDVNDHKYGDSHDLGAMIDTILPKYRDLILQIVDNVSYSREVKRGLDDLGKFQVLRDIVSDADKWEALGKEGIRRARVFHQAREPTLTEAQLDKHVLGHIDEKLLTLHQYCKTPYGRAQAEILTEPIYAYKALNLQNTNK